VVLTLLLVALLAAAAFIACRWVLTRWDQARAGLSRPFPKVSMTLCLVGALACAVPLWLHDRLEHELAAAASAVAGTDVEVHCQTASQTFTEAGAELGFVRWGADGIPEHSTVLAWETCQDLRSWLRSDRRSPTTAQVTAVHVLTHETMHMVGIKDEAHAECAAVQRDARTATALGASRAQAAELARTYWAEVYPHMPDGYTGGCGPEGRYDERLPDAPW